MMLLKSLSFGNSSEYKVLDLDMEITLLNDFLFIFLDFISQIQR